MKKNLLIAIFFLLLAGCATDPSYDDTRDKEFLEQNAQREDVTVTESGLQYRVIEEGDGENPASESVVFVEYEGKFVNGETFEKTDKITYFRLDQVIPGLGEGIQLMTAGSVYELVVPPELAFDDGRVLIIEMDLSSFLMDPQQFLNQNAQEEGILVTENGLQYRVIEDSEGAQPRENSNVRLHYTGTFTNGHVFDSSGSGDPAQFNLANVIPGFREAVQLMNEGSTYEVFIPADLGYGDDRPQLGNVLVFEIELLHVLD